MSTETVIWLSVLLFIVHEFEEIIFIRPWQLLHQDDPRVRHQIFWQLRNYSTSTIAMLILEEYIFFAGIALCSVLTKSPQIFAGFLVPYTLHLASHIFESIRLRMRTPSVITSVLTLPWYVWTLVVLILPLDDPTQVVIWITLFSIIIAANFSLLYRNLDRVEHWIHRGVEVHRGDDTP